MPCERDIRRVQLREIDALIPIVMAFGPIAFPRARGNAMRVGCARAQPTRRWHGQAGRSGTTPTPTFSAKRKTDPPMYWHQ
jgi:hypothetical protein